MRAMTLFWCEKSESTLLSPSSVVLYPFPHFPLPPFQYPHLQCPCEQPCFPFSQRQRGRGDLSPTGKEANPRSKWPDAKIIISFSESLSLCLGLDVWQWPLIPEQHHPSANPRDRGSHGFPIYKMGTAQMQAWRLSKEGACTQSHPVFPLQVFLEATMAGGPIHVAGETGRIFVAETGCLAGSAIPQEDLKQTTSLLPSPAEGCCPDNLVCWTSSADFPSHQGGCQRWQ
jgi:hypothetical protein